METPREKITRDLLDNEQDKRVELFEKYYTFMFFNMHGLYIQLRVPV